MPPMRINLLSYTYHRNDGYGRWGQHMARALPRNGVGVFPVPYESVEWPGWLQRQLGIDWSRPTISLMPPFSLRPLPGRNIAYTMYEGDRIPEKWCESLNDMVERIIVPAEWLDEVFHASGVKKAMPIHTVNGGIDPDEFPIIARQRGRVFTFMALGDRGGRKGHDLVEQAFWKAFGPNPNVRMIIKCRSGNLDGRDSAMSDPRVSVWRDDTERMADVYAHADCFVFPSRAEGWGLPPREAAATGLPVIATDWSGLSVGIDCWAYPLKKFRLDPAPLEGNGRWATPDVDELAEKMVWVYEHQAEAAAFGRGAAEWLRANQTWDHAAQQFKQVMEGIL